MYTRTLSHTYAHYSFEVMLWRCKCGRQRTLLNRKYKANTGLILEEIQIENSEIRLIAFGINERLRVENKNTVP